MQYQATVVIGDNELEALGNGSLKLQAGQWIKLKWADRKARWVGVNKTGTLWAAHWSGRHDPAHFGVMCANIDRGEA